MNDKPRFRTWRDVLFTPAIWLATLAFAGAAVAFFRARFGVDLFGLVLIFFAALSAVTVLAIRVIRWFFPLREGVFSFETSPMDCYVWNLVGFLSSTNLGFQYLNALLPPIFRKLFYRLMGARLGRGPIVIGGRLADPPLITIEDDAIIGDEALLLPHMIAVTPSDTLVLIKIHVGKGAYVGARSVLMPGVHVGERSVIQPMSYVPMQTKIPPYEVWGGNPAKKVSDIRRADLPPDALAA